jgi:hypothetical protein
MARINLDDRPMPGGSFVSRLNPRIAQTGLNQKIGGEMPNPLVHCNDRRVPDQQGGRRGRIGLTGRLEK